MLGTPEGVYRFTVARPKGGALTVEAKPLAPHAEVTRLHVHDATLHVEGAVPTEAEEPAFLFARRRGDAMEVVAPARVTAGRFDADLDLADLALPGDQRDVWNLRLEVARKGYRLGTHFDGIPNRNDASEYPAAAGRRAPHPAVLHGREQRLGALGDRRRGRARRGGRRGRADAGPAAARAARDPRAPAGAAARGAAAREREARRARRPHPHPPRVGDGRHGARGDEPGGVARRERPLGRGRERRAAEGAAVLPVPRRRRGHRRRRPAQGRRLALEAPQPARAPRRLRLPVVQPAHRPAAAAPPAQDARRGRDRHAPELQPARLRARCPRARSPSPRSTRTSTATARGSRATSAAATAASARSRC